MNMKTGRLERDRSGRETRQSIAQLAGRRPREEALRTPRRRNDSNQFTVAEAKGCRMSTGPTML